MDHPVTSLSGTKAIGPQEGKSFWQPVPANGFVRCILSSGAVDSRTPFSIGTQTVAPKSHIREHTHDHHDEIIYFLSGRGVARLEGAESEVVSGTTVFIGANRKHSFHNSGEVPLTFIWILMPGGLDEFFEAIGRPKTEGELPPAPFPRPLDVQAIEKRTVFGWADQSRGAAPS